MLGETITSSDCLREERRGEKEKKVRRWRAKIRRGRERREGEEEKRRRGKRKKGRGGGEESKDG